jgi:hypothetical protein
MKPLITLGFFSTVFVAISGCDKPVADTRELPPVRVTPSIHTNAPGTTTSPCECNNDADCLLQECMSATCPDHCSCFYENLDNASCDADSNACTVDDYCLNGQCVAGTLTECSSDECHSGSCDPVTGKCVNTAMQEGESCSPIDKCVVNATCQSGQCVGTPKTCPSSTQCTSYHCNADTGNCNSVIEQDRTSCSRNDCPSLCFGGNCTCVDENGDPIDGGTVLDAGTVEDGSMMNDGSISKDGGQARRDSGTQNSDLSSGRGADAGGCSIGRSPAGTETMIWGLALALLLVRRRGQRQL